MADSLSATPMALPSRDNIIIRAPLTLDDDSDFESSVSSKNSIASDSDGFLNRDDGFETASDSPNSNPPQDVLIRLPNVESSPSPRPNGFVRTFGSSHGLASLLHDSGDADPPPVDDKVSRSPASPVVVGRKTPRVRLPVARASMDMDDDLEEDAGFLTGANVPILRRIRSAPKATLSVLSEGDDLTSGNGKDGDIVQDKALDSSKEDEVDGEHSLTSGHEHSMHSNDEIREIDVVSVESKFEDSIDVREHTELRTDLGCNSNGDQLDSNDEIREIDVINDPTPFAEANVKLMETHVVSSDEDHLVFIQDKTSHHLENENVREIRSIHSCVDIEEVCPATLSEKMLVDKGSIRLHGKEEDSILLMDAPPKINEIKNPNLLEAPFPYGETEKPLTKTEKEKIQKIQQIRANYLRFLHLLGCHENPVVSKVLHQLNIAEGKITSQVVHLDSKKSDNLDLSICILVIGKSGVGKSSTVNSICGEKKAATDAFEAGTTSLKDISVMVDGVKLKVIDTPGLKSSVKDQSINRKVLLSVKRAMQRSPPDVILYVDRLDTVINDLNDLHVLRSVTACLGSSIWQKAVIALTHASSVPPDGAHGYPISYEAFVARRSECVQQLIRRSTDAFVMANPVALIENNPAAGKLLHCGESWRSQLLLLCYTMKTLSQVSSVVAGWNPLCIEKLFRMPIHSSRDHAEFTNDHSSESVDSDIRNENLPLFVRLKKSQASKMIRRSLLEYDYLVKLLHANPMRSFRDLSEAQNATSNGTCLGGFVSEEIWRLETIPLPLGDMAVLPSFDGDIPSCYSFLDIESTTGKTGSTSFGKNRTAADASIAILGEHTVFGFKIEDNVTVGERLMLVKNASIVTSQDNAACGANVELCRGDMDNPFNCDQISLGLSVMKFRDNLTCRCSLHSQFSVGNSSRIKLTASLSNKLGMHVYMKANCSEPTQVAALALLPVARAVLEKLFFSQSIKD